MNLSRWLWVGIVAWLVLPLSAQSVQGEYREGELIVQLFPDKKVEDLEQSLVDIQLHRKRLLSRRMNIWLVSYNPQQVSASGALDAVYRHPSVILAQFNHYVARRDTFPDDPLFPQQWALNNTGQSGGTPDADIDAPEAWDFATGGQTATGDDIVVAVIDGGADLAHQDIAFWKNVHEIPNNGIDDDNNGYVDDYDGWNAYNHTGNIPSDFHGTHVSGIAGALGNNGIGVSGVNWNIKIMPIAGSSTTESVVVEAYGYVLEIRARYNETNGDSGAFVVVTNSSFGVDFGDPNDYPIWCAMYDSMGVQGILSCAATANLNINIDVEGDVPTACPSDYLISVTNTTHTDHKNSGAAYGATTIDLGAPGTNILSTTPGNGYGTATGTSMATPTVAGAVALLFAAAPPSLIQEYKAAPDQIALLFKQWILDGVDSIPDLIGTTVSGGRLNVFNSIQEMLGNPFAAAPEPPQNLYVYSDYTTPTSMLLNWEDPTHLVNGDSLTPDVFSIYIKRDGLLIDSVSGGVGQYTDIGLTDGQMYHYEIYSRVDTTGATSEGVTASWIAGGSPIPSPPINFSVSGGQQEITLTWTVPTTNVDGTPMDDYAGVNLYRNGVFVDFLGGVPSDTGAVMSVNYSPNPPGLYEWFITIVDNESPPNESAPSDTMGTPLNIPLGDMFDVPGTPNPGMWITEYTEINDRSNNPPTGSLALNLNGQPIGEDIIDLKPVDLTGLEGSGIALNYWYQPQGNGNAPEENDSLRVYFKNDQGEWVLVAAYPGSPLQPFMQETIFLDSVSAQGGTYFFSQFQVRFRSTGGAGNFPNDDWFIDDVTLAPVVGIGDEELATETFHLNQNYPNPFNPETQIEFSIPKAEMVSLKVYDVLGREIQTLVKGRLTPGKYQIRWDGRDQHGQPVASGVYFYRLKTRDFAQIRKMILLR